MKRKLQICPVAKSPLVHFAINRKSSQLLLALFLCWTVFASLLSISAQESSPPSVTTDRVDYRPGDTAVITGSGFQAGETVTVQVVHADGTPSTGQDHEPWTVTAAADGTFSTTWHVCEDDCVGETLLVTAVGAASGVSAQVLFTDTGPPAFAYAWGFGGLGQVGNGTFLQFPTPVQVSSVTGGLTAVIVAAGQNHSLAIANDGSAWAWGSDSSGQLGNGPGLSTSTPVPVGPFPVGKKVVSISGGSAHSLATLDDGTAWGWGANSVNQLGDGTVILRTVPNPVSVTWGTRTISAVAAGNNHSLARANDGSVWAWGNNGNGRIGDGTTTLRTTPVQVSTASGMAGINAIAAGSAHSLAVANDGTLWAWGFNGSGQLGDNTLTERLTPVQVQPLPLGRTAIAVAAGFNHSLALADDGTVWAWGDGSFGQVGNGVFISSKVPVQVNLPVGRKAVAIGSGAISNHCLAALDDGTVWTWGRDLRGQLGNDAALVNSATPVQAVGLLVGHKAVVVAGGADHSLAAVQDNSAPVAKCKSVTVSAGANCTASASIDDGSNDPDSGDAITLMQTPAGPYPLGSTTVMLTVTDSHGATASCSAIVTVTDTTAPVPNSSTLSDVIAQCSAALPAAPTATDACDGPITATTSAPTAFSQGDFIIVWTFTDSHGNSTTQNQAVHVHDTFAPLPNSSSLPDVVTQCSVTLPAAPTATDACDGSITATTSAPTAFGQGDFIIVWTYTDSHGNSTTQNQAVHVHDTLAPVPNSSSLPDVVAQCSVMLPTAPIATDACDGPITATTSAPPTFSQGDFTIVWMFTDSHGNSTTQNQAVHVHDTLAPVPNAASLPDATGECSATITTAPTATDNCGGMITGTTTDSLTRTTQGMSMVTWIFDDGHGNSSSQTQSIVVHDYTAPTISCPVSVSIGACAGVVPDIIPSLVASDNCTATAALTATQDPPAGTAIGPGVNSIVVTVADEAGNSTSCSVGLAANNGTPFIAGILGPSEPLPLASASSITVNFTDPDISEHAVTITWDDGTTSTLTTATGATSLVATHTYATTGVYSVGVTVSDPCGLSASVTYQFIVIYDPDGGFVTGGGWINSPAGAYVANPSLTGKATFGFVAKYQHGAQVPTGNTEFQFHAASFSFKSTSYDWLVVSGAKAQYKGVGTVNGSGGYKFRLTAADGQAPGGGGVDKFRIKITTAGDGLVYDNVLGASDDVDQANPQAITNGSIVIHK